MEIGGYNHLTNRHIFSALILEIILINLSKDKEGGLYNMFIMYLVPGNLFQVQLKQKQSL